jgi:hypothetical protein
MVHDRGQQVVAGFGDLQRGHGRLACGQCAAHWIDARSMPAVRKSHKGLGARMRGIGHGLARCRLVGFVANLPPCPLRVIKHAAGGPI